MSSFWQTVILAILPVLVAGRFALTRTGKLRKDILANLDMLDRLPAEHPNRAELEVKNGELVGLLARRLRRRYGPFTQAGVFFGALVGLAGVALVMAAGTALIAAGIVPSTPSDPPTPGDQWAAAALLLVMAVGLVLVAVRKAWRQLREYPPPAQQPTEAATAETGPA